MRQETKQEIRQRILDARLRLPDGERATKSQRILETLFATDLFRRSGQIFSYYPIRGEVDTRPLLQRAALHGKRLALPCTTKQGLRFFYVEDPADLSPGRFEIPEPRDCAPADAGKETLLLLPGIAFSEQRDRIGFGKGYYDRYLAAHPHLRTIALCFDLQIVPHIPAEATDRRPELIITETRILGETQTYDT